MPLGPRKTMEAPPTQTPTPEPEASVADRAFVGTLAAIASILATRLLLLLAVCGTFVLAALSIRDPTPTAIVLVAVFGLLTIAPLAFLDLRRR